MQKKTVKYGIFNADGEIEIVFASENEARRYAMLADAEWTKLIENRWWMASDWSDEDGNFIAETKNPDVNEINDLIKKTGLTKAKIAEFAGVVPGTVSRWVSGESPIPPLVLEKLRQIDKVINEK